MDQSSQHDLCATCARIDIKDYFKRPHNSREDRFHEVGPTAEAYKLGLLQDIFRKMNDCKLCRLIGNSLCNRNENQTVDPASYVKGNELKECWIFSYVYSRNRWTDQEACRIGIATEMVLGPVCTPSELAGVIQLCWHPDGEDFGLARGRFIDPNVADLDIVRTWLPTCERLHNELCDFMADDVVKSLKVGPKELIVIDVSNWCLCYLPPGERYTALSYRWPTTGTTFVLQQAFFDSLFQEQSLGANINQLSQKIVDAIRCTFFLGEKYIWIDALCIIQDSNEHKATQIAQMDKIYSHAVLVLVAASSLKEGSEAYDGLARFSGVPAEVQQHTEFIQGMHLAVPCDAVFKIADNSQWITRAWTFQEGMLAPRKLYLTDAQIYFECSCSVFCEDSWGENLPPDTFFTPGSNLWKMGNPFFMGAAVWGSSSIRRSQYTNSLYFLNDYESFVGDYSNRAMTNQGDILNAFLGIQNVLKETGDTDFIYALPKLYVDSAILWTSRSGQRRQLRNNYLPSWSWVGWHSHIDYNYHNVIDLLVEANFYSIDENCGAAFIMTKANKNSGYLGKPERLGPNNVHFKLKSHCNSTSWESIRPTISKLIKEQNYTASEYLGCQTTAASFQVTNREEASLGDQKKLWPNSTNLVVNDGDKRWVGCILMDNDWVSYNLADGPKVFEFLLLSRSKAILELSPPRKHFDQDEFEIRDWCLLNVMMVKKDGDIVERLGTGMIHEDAWKNARRKEIQVLMV